MYKNNEKGMTLIALVVTIIVLLMLAGIALGSVSDNDGIVRGTGTMINKVDSYDRNQKEKINTLMQRIE